MYQTALRNSSLYALLLQLDQDLGLSVRAAGCPTCRGKLHCADYRRKPRGGPADLGTEYCWRISFCCAEDGCRRRQTPPSLRFLDRKVYFSVYVLLLAALRHGPTPHRVRELSQHFPVSERTIRRWQRWWREALPQRPVWVALKGRFAQPLDESQLPLSLLEAFGHLGDLTAQVVAVLRSLLSPEAVGVLGERAW